MKLSVKKLKLMIQESVSLAEVIDYDLAKKRYISLAKQAMLDPSAQSALFGFMRSVNIDDEDISRVRLSLKSHNRPATVSLLMSIASDAFGDKS